MNQIKPVKIKDIIGRHPRHAQLFEPSGDLIGLRESIENGGKLNPIHLMKTKTGKLELIDGYSSYMVVSELELETIQAIVHPYCDDPIDLIVDLNTNLHKSYREQYKMTVAYWDLYAPGQGTRTDLHEGEEETNEDATTYDRIAKKLGMFTSNNKPAGSRVKKLLCIGRTQPGFLLSIDDGDDSLSGAYKKCQEKIRKSKATDESSDTRKVNQPLFVTSETDQPSFDDSETTVTATDDSDDGNNTSAAAASDELQIIIDVLARVPADVRKKVFHYFLQGHDTCICCGQEINKTTGEEQS